MVRRQETRQAVPKPRAIGEVLGGVGADLRSDGRRLDDLIVKAGPFNGEGVAVEEGFDVGAAPDQDAGDQQQVGQPGRRLLASDDGEAA